LEGSPPALLSPYTPDSAAVAIRQSAVLGEILCNPRLWRRRSRYRVGCVLLRHGARHDWYQNPKTGFCQPVPRHRCRTVGVFNRILNSASWSTAFRRYA